MDRWRKPVTCEVEEEGSEVWKIGGRSLRGLNWTLAPDDLERVKHGYVCINCMEPQGEPFPENCSLCAYPMRRDQDRRFQVEFQGHKDLGPTTTDAEEYDRLDEEREKMIAARKRSSRIWVPGQ